MKSANAISEDLLKALTALDIKTGTIRNNINTTDAQSIAELVETIKKYFEKHRNAKYDASLLSLYKCLISSISNLCLYYVTHPSDSQATKESDIATLGKDYLDYFFTTYKAEIEVISKQVRTRLYEYTTIGIFYKWRAVFAFSLDRTSEGLRYYSFALSILNYSNKDERLKQLSVAVSSRMPIQFAEVIANFLTNLPLEVSETDTPSFLQCFRILSPEVILNTFSKLETSNDVTSQQIMATIIDGLFKALWILRFIATRDSSNLQDDRAKETLEYAQKLVILLRKRSKHNKNLDKLETYTRVIDLEIADCYFNKGLAFLFRTSADVVTMEVLIEYIKNGKHPVIDKVIECFNQAKRQTTEANHAYLNTADCFGRMFEDLHKKGINLIVGTVVIDIFKLQKFITNFIVAVGTEAFKNKDYTFAEYLFLLARQIYPIPNEKINKGSYTYAVAADLNINYNLMRCQYMKLKRKQVNIQASQVSSPVLTESDAAQVQMRESMALYLTTWANLHGLNRVPAHLYMKIIQLQEENNAPLNDLKVKDEKYHMYQYQIDSHLEKHKESILELPSDYLDDIMEQVLLLSGDLIRKSLDLLERIFNNLLNEDQKKLLLGIGIVDEMNKLMSSKNISLNTTSVGQPTSADNDDKVDDENKDENKDEDEDEDEDESYALRPPRSG